MIVAAPEHPEYWNGPFDSLFIRLSSIIMKSYFKWKTRAQLMTADVLAAIAGEKLSMVHSLGLRLPRKSAAGPRPPRRPSVDRTATTMDEAADD